MEIKRNPRPGILLDTLMEAETSLETDKAVIIIIIRATMVTTLIRDMQAITMSFSILRRLLRSPTKSMRSIPKHWPLTSLTRTPMT